MSGYQYRGKQPHVFIPKQRELKPCGTEAAYKRHLFYREIPCDECVTAHREYLRKWRRANPDKRRRTLQPCGTLSAHARHKRRKEPIDDACQKARREYQRDLRARKKAAIR